MPDFYVNPKTRMCRALSGPPDELDRMAAEAKRDGFVPVTEAEMGAFREVTAQALADGWNPDRMRYDTWLKKQGVQP